MPVRIATYADLKSVAKILAAAFDNEELNAYFFPYRKQHPEDYLKAWYQVVLEKWWDYSNIWVVSYEPKEPVVGTIHAKPGSTISQEGNVTGVAQWARTGLGSEKLWGLHGSWDPSESFNGLTLWALIQNSIC